MGELIADLFVSLDGFAAGVDVGAFFGYPGPGLDAWIREATEQPQLMLMGRVTYEALAAISSTATDEASTRMNDLPKAVYSNTLREPLAWRNTRLVRGDLAERVRALKRESDVPLRSIGSLTLVGSLVELGLVDRLRVMVFPLTLGGDGREPAYAGYPRTGLELAGTRVIDSRIVLLEYRPASCK
ncbi:dihydrofolate reductase family protein [Microbispora sp. NEAU-D428]|uniref:dihydrofolate reductase family protein n=1 Tax=Microbispora sitophila TaxID=2771537 RepID=UPI001866F8CB|nr:dihydrofolate reductase family protein [Microbispora sitophila]MBE3014920.1 dihydrofolate reductase family protein [Microbispora sitophila]